MYLISCLNPNTDLPGDGVTFELEDDKKVIGSVLPSTAGNFTLESLGTGNCQALQSVATGTNMDFKAAGFVLAVMNGAAPTISDGTAITYV